MNEIKRIHGSKCINSNCDEILLSFDGVQESKSSTTTTDVFSVAFKNCNKIYPLRLIRPTNKFKYDEQIQIKNVLDDIKKSCCKIICCVCDNPKRAEIRCALCHSATYACEYCEANAVRVSSSFKADEEILITVKKFELQRKSIDNTIEFLKESPGSKKSKEKDDKKIKELKLILKSIDKKEEKEVNAIKNKKQLAWPYSTRKGTLRTVDLIKYLVNKIETTPDLDKQEKKGFKGKSHFLYLENFHFIYSIPAEYMHSGCLGTVKRLLELTFSGGEKRETPSKRKLCDPEIFNRLIKKIQVIREFSRRCRNLDFGVLKAQEYRNFILFFFVIIIDCIGDKYPNEQKVWLYLAFMLRACVIPNTEFDEIELIHVKNASQKFYYLFQKCFGQKNCSYSIHIIGSHLLRIRGDEPLTDRSAFRFESFYSEMKNLFKPGTNSSVKQVLQNTMMKRTLESHYCTKPIKYSCQKKPNHGMENNSMIYVLNDKNEHEIFNIIEMDEQNSFKCTKQGKYEYRSNLTPEINWSSVGVYEAGPSSEVVKTIKKKEIHGKVLKVNNFLITCPINVLNEQ